MNLRSLIILFALSFAACLAACGDTADSSPEAGLTQETVDGPAPSPKADAPMFSTRQVEFEPPREVLEKEDRRVITTAESFEEYFGAQAPEDLNFATEWIVFYTPGLQQTGGYEASIESVQYAKTGESIQIVTRLSTSGVDCSIPPYNTRPYTIVSFPKPAVRPQSVRYYTDDITTNCGAEACELAFLEDVVPAIQGVIFISEGDGYWDTFFHLGQADALGDEGAMLQFFGEPEDAYIREADFEQLLYPYFDHDPETADEWELELEQSYTAIREALEANLQDIRVYRVGEVEVRVYVVGVTSCGDLAGISTISIET